MTVAINKTMHRDDLFEPDAIRVASALDQLIGMLYAHGLYTTSWYGSLPDLPISLSQPRVHSEAIGMDNRGPTYEPLPGAADDARLPWYLYWETAWLYLHGPALRPGMRLLDAGGTSSLFTCYLASLGHEVHSIDLKPALVENGDRIARHWGWGMHSYFMDMTALSFADEFFDHAYSVCVFEHLDQPAKQSALREVARCLKPGGHLSITFDYRNPAPSIVGKGPDPSAGNQLSTPEDLRRCFLSAGYFRLLGNQDFRDDGSSWLVHPRFANAPYTFGALFLQKI